MWPCCGHAGHMVRGVAVRERGVRLVALRRGCRMRGGRADPEAERDQRSNTTSHHDEHSDGVQVGKFVDRLAAAEIGATFNFYREGGGADLRRERLHAYLEEHRHAELLLVGEAPGWRGTRISGIPFTSERQLTGLGPAEASA